MSSRRRIQVLSIIEAVFVTGQEKNIFDFGRRARQQEENLDAVDLSFIAYRRGSDPESMFVAGAREAGFPVEIVHERGRFDGSVIPQLRRIVAQQNPDIVQTQNVKSHCLLRLSGIWRERIWVAFQHGYTVPDFKMLCYNQVDRWSLRAAQQVVAVCGPFQQTLIARGIRPARAAVLHNSVNPMELPDADAVRKLRDELRIPEGTAVVVSIGRLSREKGFVDLVEAAAKLKARGVNFRIVLVGEGHERPRIEEARSRLGLNDWVLLVGRQLDVRPYYALADVVAMPSHSEGSPNVLLEAMIAGRAVAATRAGGIPEIARDEETALLVPARDPSAMAGAIERLMGDRSLRERLTKNARELAISDYSPDMYRRRLVQLYERLVDAKRVERQRL